jgi:kynurenine formamidase
MPNANVRAESESVDQVLALLGKLKVVDLAPLLERGIPRWPTHPHLTIDKAVTHEHDGYYCQAIMMAEHTAAHVDAPAHMLPDRMDRTIDKVAPDRLIAAAVVYNFAPQKLGPGDMVTPAMIEAHEAKTGIRVGAGEIALINFGWMERYWRTDGKAQWYVLNAPGINEDAVRLLRDRGVRAVGTDTVAGETAIVDGKPGDNPGHTISSSSKCWPIWRSCRPAASSSQCLSTSMRAPALRSVPSPIAPLDSAGVRYAREKKRGRAHHEHQSFRQVGNRHRGRLGHRPRHRRAFRGSRREGVDL